MGGRRSDAGFCGIRGVTSVSPIGDMTTAGSTLSMNVVAVDTDNDPITVWRPLSPS
jgi:hypothetical protein